MVVIDVYWFCFFKQKTAYEMRISDWSSDVCSSDLRLVEHDHRRLHHERPRHLEQLALPAGERARELVAHVVHLEATQQGVRPLLDGSLLRPPEIGRASCRERVCQYV